MEKKKDVRQETRKENTEMAEEEMKGMATERHKGSDFTHALLQSDNHVSLCDFQTQSACPYTRTNTHGVFKLVT